MKLLRYILLPIVPIYCSVSWLRNKLYDIGWLSSQSYDIPIICVGNLSVGGTGKSPMIEYLTRLLKVDYSIAILSRGYKRQSSGFKLADKYASVAMLGDEPFQFYKKFEDVLVSVDADRQNGIAQLQRLNTPPEIVLLDDAFQHRKVKAGLNILLTSFNALYVNDFCLPTGNLREPGSGADRADIIVVTKCPRSLNETDREGVKSKLKPLKHQSVFFSFIEYADTIVSPNKTMPLKSLKDTFLLVTGIANATPLVSYLKNCGYIFNHLNFSDHHEFTDSEIAEINVHKKVLTTEKDFWRLEGRLSTELYYLPIEIKFFEENDFNDVVLNHLSGK